MKRNYLYLKELGITNNLDHYKNGEGHFIDGNFYNYRIHHQIIANAEKLSIFRIELYAKKFLDETYPHKPYFEFKEICNEKTCDVEIVEFSGNDFYFDKNEKIKNSFGDIQVNEKYEDITQNMFDEWIERLVPFESNEMKSSIWLD